jgi:hypothetical protein
VTAPAWGGIRCDPAALNQRGKTMQLGHKTKTLKPHGLFNTPESFDVIEEWINRHPKEERVYLMTAAMMTWNYACKVANDE